MVDSASVDQYGTCTDCQLISESRGYIERARRLATSTASPAAKGRNDYMPLDAMREKSSRQAVALEG